MGENTSVLLVDDDPDIAELVIPALKRAGYQARHVRDADEAFATLKKQPVSVLLLDFEMPGISGMKFLEILKEDSRTASIPVIMMTVRGEEKFKVQGLTTGADDYLVKPLSMKELVARIEALLRRANRSGRVDNVAQAGALAVDLDRKEVSVQSKRVKLTATEFELLALFMKHKGYALSYRTISETLGIAGGEMTSHNLYMHVKNLREKLGPEGDRIETVHGTGYKFIDS